MPVPHRFRRKVPLDLRYAGPCGPVRVRFVDPRPTVGPVPGAAPRSLMSEPRPVSDRVRIRKGVNALRSLDEDRATRWLAEVEDPASWAKTLTWAATLLAALAAAS